MLRVQEDTIQRQAAPLPESARTDRVELSSRNNRLEKVELGELHSFFHHFYETQDDVAEGKGSISTPNNNDAKPMPIRPFVKTEIKAEAEAKVATHLHNRQDSDECVTDPTNNNNLDGEVDSFLRDFERVHEVDSFYVHDSSTRGRYYHMTMRQWIRASSSSTSKRNLEKETTRDCVCVSASSSQTQEVLRYIKSALPIALKLTEILLCSNNTNNQDQGQTKMDDHEKNIDVNDVIPLASIAAENIFIEASSARELTVTIARGSPGSNQAQDQDTKNLGEPMPRLCALGVVLCELFCRQEPQVEGVTTKVACLSVNSSDSEGADADADAEISNPRPRKKSQKYDHDEYSECISNIEAIMGIPYSICALVRNLLACGRGKQGEPSQQHENDNNDTYTSMEDVKLDIQLMINDPARFLENIITNRPYTTSATLTGSLPPNKLYGREHEIAMFEKSYQQQLVGKCNGVVITGKAGVGKSALTMHIQKKLSDTKKSNTNANADADANADANAKTGHYFLKAKFDQYEHAKKPLLIIGNMFNSLCEQFEQDATPSQLKSVEDVLQSTLGSQVSLLTEALSSLKKLMPSSYERGEEGFKKLPGTSSDCAPTERSISPCLEDSAAMQFVFGELLRVISSHSRHISLFLDDLQWADSFSLLLVKSLISTARGSSSVFFTCCYRDQDKNVNDSEPFNLWLSSISMLPVDTIRVETMTVEGVNELVKDALHLSPRLTHPLATVLHKKTRGNPLYLRQLLNSLRDQSCIYVDLSGPRWNWDFQKINDLKMSGTVLALLSQEMQKLDRDLQLGLAVASCMGSCVRADILDIISNNLKVDLQGILKRVSKRGFMDNVGNGEAFRFGHDKIQQAAYEMMDDGQRRKNHMRFGLAICAHTMNDGGDNDDFFFIAINQLNMGGALVITDPSQRTMIAALNLKAGKRSNELADATTAFKLYKHGISFLASDSWSTNYELSLNLFDSAAEAACVINRRKDATVYTQQVFDHARCSDDKLNCMISKAKALSLSEMREGSIETLMQILEQLGEPPLRPLADTKLQFEMQETNHIIQHTMDDEILNQSGTKDRKILTLMRVYLLLITVLHFCKSSHMMAASLRMMKLGLGSRLVSPHAMAFYGELQASLGNHDLAHRLGRLALILVEKKEFSRVKAAVFATVYQTIMWRHTPFQSISNAHMVGQKVAQQAGNVIPSVVNGSLVMGTRYAAGYCLNDLRKKCQSLTLQLLHENVGFTVDYLSLLHVHFSVCIEGLHKLDDENIDSIPGKAQIIAKARKTGDSPLLLANYAHHLARTLFFRKFDATSLGVSISDMIFNKQIPLRPILVFAIFTEGLVAFQFARQTKDELASKWMAKGNSVLSKMQCWNEHCPWNFQNKMLLLEAERMSILGENEQALSLYERSIRSANDHKFLHEEAVSSELAGLFCYRQGIHLKAHVFLSHSVKCFNKWGAIAISRRVEESIQTKFGSNLALYGLDDLTSLSSKNSSSSKKRQR